MRSFIMKLLRRQESQNKVRYSSDSSRIHGYQLAAKKRHTTFVSLCSVKRTKARPKNSTSEQLSRHIRRLEEQLDGDDGVSSIALAPQFLDPDDFFDDPNEVASYQEQKIIAEWIIIDFDSLHEDFDEKSTNTKLESVNRPLGVIKGQPIYNFYDIESFDQSLMGPLLQLSAEDEDEKNDETADRTDVLDIREIFGLSNRGDILLHIDHIIEDKGDEISRSELKSCETVRLGEEITEMHRFRRPWIQIVLKFVLELGCKKGHPHNKTQSGSPGELVEAYALSLANNHTSTFSRNIENFISCTKESKESAPQVVMRNMRQFMSGMKNYLVKHGEADFQREVQRACSRLKPNEFLNLDTILESVMHRLVVLPLREHLYNLFVDFYMKSGDLKLLVKKIQLSENKQPNDFGIDESITPPTSAALVKLSLLILKLQDAELPLEKLDLLLAVISSLFESAVCPQGQLSADDFLPLLIYMVAKCGFVSAEIEAEFMWGLLQPSLLNGEAGYYLTSLCSAVHMLKSVSNAEDSLVEYRAPPLTHVLRVVIPDEYNGSLQTKTLPVRPHTTSKELCRRIASMARITNAQDYALFRIVNGEETLLQDNECPQDVVQTSHKGCIAYKRIDAKIAWPNF